MPMRSFVIACLLCLFAAPALIAQDTLQFMQYNVLNYGQTSGFCEIDCKDRQFKRVLKYRSPELLVANEVAANSAYPARIRDQILNQAGRAGWRHAPLKNPSQSSIVSLLFYDSDVLGLKATEVIQVNPRDIPVFTLYYKSPALANGADTLFFRVLAAHFSAGSGAGGARTNMANRVMQYLRAQPAIENNFLMGDLNLYGSSEPAYDTLRNSGLTQLTFNDPIQRPGSWNSNDNFAGIHTQSTRKVMEADGGAGGGSDSRFDFILTSDAVQQGSGRIGYLAGSYEALGQSGQQFDESVKENPNISIELQQALYKLSDHYPVLAKFRFDVTPVSQRERRPADREGLQLAPNPVQERLRLTGPAAPLAQRIQIIDSQGRRVKQLRPSAAEPTLEVRTLPKGLYFLHITTAAGRRYHRRFIKN